MMDLARGLPADEESINPLMPDLMERQPGEDDSSIDSDSSCSVRLVPKQKGVHYESDSDSDDDEDFDPNELEHDDDSSIPNLIPTAKPKREGMKGEPSKEEGDQEFKQIIQNASKELTEAMQCDEDVTEQEMLYLMFSQEMEKEPEVARSFERDDQVFDDLKQKADDIEELYGDLEDLQINGVTFAEEEETEQVSFATKSEEGVVESAIDSGATAHMLQSDEGMTGCRPPDKKQAMFGNGSKGTIEKQGTSHQTALENNCHFDLPKSQHCPSLHRNLISLQRMIDDGWTPEFSKNSCILTRGKQKLIFRRKNNLYVMKSKPTVPHEVNEIHVIPDDDEEGDKDKDPKKEETDWTEVKVAVDEEGNQEFKQIIQSTSKELTEAMECDEDVTEQEMLYLMFSQEMEKEQLVHHESQAYNYSRSK